MEGERCLRLRGGERDLERTGERLGGECLLRTGEAPRILLAIGALVEGGERDLPIGLRGCLRPVGGGERNRPPPRAVGKGERERDLEERLS